MKKILMTLMAVMALTVLSCGNQQDPEQKAAEYVQKMYDAQQAGDTETMKQLVDEAAEWNKGLSEDDKVKAERGASEKIIEIQQKELEKIKK